MSFILGCFSLWVPLITSFFLLFCFLNTSNSASKMRSTSRVKWSEQRKDCKVGETKLRSIGHKIGLKLHGARDWKKHFHTNLYSSHKVVTSYRSKHFGREQMTCFNQPIFVQCCISHRNQSFDLQTNQMTGFYMKYNVGLK